MKTFEVATTKEQELIDITRRIREVVSESNIREGFCAIFVPHTTAGVTINENADPDVRRDIIKGLEVIPKDGYRHSEGNSPAHIKSSLVGPSVTIFIKDGRLLLGTWQGVYLAEFDGPRRRSIWIKAIEG